MIKDVLMYLDMPKRDWHWGRAALEEESRDEFGKCIPKATVRRGRRAVENEIQSLNQLPNAASFRLPQPPENYVKLALRPELMEVCRYR
jgi:hypothetical protein